MQLSREDLLDAYRRMRTIREFEERVKVEFEKGNIPGFVHLSSGEEASAVGVCMNLVGRRLHRRHPSRPWPIHRQGLRRGSDDAGDLRQGRRALPRQGRLHAYRRYRKGHAGRQRHRGRLLPLAIGAALTAKTLKNGKVAIAFLGDGASNQGLTFEAMNMAVVLNLPCVFVIENNGYGEFTGIDYHAGNKDLADRAKALGMPATTVDGYDFFAVHDAAREAWSGCAPAPDPPRGGHVPAPSRALPGRSASLPLQAGISRRSTPTTP